MSSTRSPSGVRNYSSSFNEGKAAPVFQHIYDATVVYTTTQGRNVTGAWRAVVPADLASNVSISGGLTANISAVAVTGNPQVTVSNPQTFVGITGTPSFTVANPVIAVTGNFGSSSIAITGNPQVTISNPIIPVSGNLTANINSVAVTGGVTVNNTSLNIVNSGGWVGITGNVATTISNPQTFVGITGTPSFTMANPIIAVSGDFGSSSVAITGNPQVTVSNPVYLVGITGQPLNVTGNFGMTGAISITSVAVTGGVTINNTSANPVPVSGNFSLSGRIAIDNVAVTGGVSISNTSLNIVNSGGWVGITGTPSFTVANTSANPVPVSGIMTLSGTLDIGEVNVTGTTFVKETTGTFSFNLTGVSDGQFQIPIGTLAYSIVVESGRAVVNGLPIYSVFSFGGGGYGDKKQLSNQINIGITGGRAVVFWEI